jgi:hypothetical protein
LKSILVGVALLGTLVPVFADELPESKKALGKPESIICGFNSMKTTMGGIIKKLGHADKQTPFSASDPVNVLMEWNKGPLNIGINTYVIEGFENNNPVWIRVQGSDPDGYCKTGSGVKLGDSFESVKKVYGNRYGVDTVEGEKYIVYQWKNFSEISFTLTPSNLVKSIYVYGDVDP